MAGFTIHDETATGRVVGTITLPDVPSGVTVRELVRQRVREEVAKHNAQPASTYRGLVRPTDAEVTANGYVLRSPRQLDREKLIEARPRPSGCSSRSRRTTASSR